MRDVPLVGHPPDVGHDVDVRRLRAEHSDAALLLAPMLERIELEMLHRVLVRDLGDRRRGEVAQQLRDLFGRVRPVRVAVREIGFPAEIGFPVEIGSLAKIGSIADIGFTTEM